MVFLNADGTLTPAFFVVEDDLSGHLSKDSFKILIIVNYVSVWEELSNHIYPLIQKYFQNESPHCP